MQSMIHLHIVLGSKPPKAARDDYDKFLRLVGGCMGDQTPFDEVAAAAEALWNAISDVPIADPEKRLSPAALLQPYRQASCN